MRPLVPLAILFALALASLATSATPREGRGHEDSDASSHAEAHWNNTSDTAHAKGLDRAAAHHLFARLAYDAGTGIVDGRYLHFHLVAATGQMHDYTARDGSSNYTFFSAVTPSSFTADGAPRVTGSILHVKGENLTAMAHNNPTAALHLHATAAATVTFQLASGATILNATAREVKIGVGGIHGHILSNGNASITVSGTTVTVPLAAGESLMFRAHPSGVDTSVLHAQNKAFTQRQLGVVLHVADGGGEAIEDGAEDGASAETTEIGHGHVTFNVSSTQHAGRVIFLAIDGETIDPAHASSVQVTLGGEAVPRAKNSDEVVSGNQSAVAFTTDTTTGAVYATIRVPHFSTYVLALVDPSVGADSTTTASGAAGNGGSMSGTGGSTSQSAPGAGLLLVGVALLGAALRRR